MPIEITKTVLEKLTYEEKGSTYLKPCLDIAFYWSGSVFDRSDGIMRLYQQCLDTIGESLAYFRTDTMSTFRPLKKDTLGLLPFWFHQKAASRRDIYALVLESGLTPNESSDRAFALCADPLSGYVRLVLPASSISQSVPSYLALARNMGQMFSYDFGHAGYAINWNHVGEHKKDVLRAMYSLGNRYPGLDMAHPFCTKYIASKGIKCVNWLTFLSKDSCDRLGGLPALKMRFGNSVVIHDAYNNGAMIQAGPFPEIGDVNRQENLPIYHQVGKVLAPIRCREHPRIFGPEGIGDDEATEKWLSRFDS